MRRITEKLAYYISRIKYSDFPNSAINIAKLAAMDTIGAGIAAGYTDVGKLYLKTKPQTDNGCCSILGEGKKTSLMEACFINASLCQILDFDDTYEINSFAVSHPGPAVIPAALSVGEKINCSGKELIKSIILGYEVVIRVAKAIEPRKDEFWGFANTQIMGAVTTAGILLGLNEKELVMAIGIAAACSPVANTNMMWSLEKRPISWVKDGVGFVVSTGVMSALLAKNGFIGSRRGLDKEDKYYLLCGSENYNEREIVKNFGEKYEIENLSFKPYPTCRFMQSTLDAISYLLIERNIKTQNIKRIEIYLPPSLARFFAEYEPGSMIDAQFSLPYAVAMIINKEIPSLLWYEKNKLSNQTIKNIAQKVSLIPDLEIERLRAEKNILSPRVKILMSDGAEYENNQKYAKGHPCKPFSLEDFKEKFRNNLSPIRKQNRIDEIMEAVLKLDEFTSISDFIKLLSI